MLRIMLSIAGATAVLVAAAAIFLLMKDPDTPVSPAAVSLGDTELGGPFTLTDQTGRRITSAEVIDGPTLVYFGYTFCPDVCPVDTQVMVEAVELLAARGIEVTPVFVTVDPARDDVEALRYWAEAHHPEMIALTGSDEDIRNAAGAYRVYYDKVEAGDGAAGYLMNHSAFTYFMMPDGIAGLFRNGFPPEEMAAEVERILRNRGAV